MGMKKMMQQCKKMVSLLITAALMLSLLPVTASAAGSDFTVTGGTGYTYNAGVLTFTESGTYTVSMTTPGALTKTDRIVVSSGVTASITLSSVKIDQATSDGCAFDMAGATVNLTLSGDNILQSGINNAGLRCPDGATLVIDGAGTLTATAWYGSAGGGSGKFGAGIGGSSKGTGAPGSYDAKAGNITIKSGTVTAVGGMDAAGIGGGSYGEGGTVTITGGTVTAIGGYCGAGIGSGSVNEPYGPAASAGSVTISGGSVLAQGGGGLGLGDEGANIGTGGVLYIAGTEIIPTNGYGANVYLTKVTLSGISSATAVSSLTTNAGYAYGNTDMKTDKNGKLYLYLPENTLTSAAVTASTEYEGTVTTTTTAGTSLGTLSPKTADLAITVTDGVATAIPGEAVTYTITATNSGLSNVSGASVDCTFPASLSATWTAVGTGGGTCTASGSGNISDTVTLPANASVTYTVVASINSGASGSLSTTATVSPPAGVTDPDPGNNSATDTDTLTAQGDLTITITDGGATAIPGGAVTYIITATNGGPSNVSGVSVDCTFPASLSATWTAVGAGGGACTASGSGNISDTVTLPANASVTYTVMASISSSASGTLSTTATVSPPAGVTDPTPGNDSATDTDTLLSTDATLSGLSLSQGTLSPVFSGGTTAYTALVANSITSLTVTPTVHNANASVKVNGTAVSSGNASGNITLAVGANTITVLVTAQDSTTTLTYTLTVTRAASSGSEYTSPGYNAGVSGGGSLPITVNLGTNTASVNVDAQIGRFIAGGGNKKIKMPSIPGVSRYSLGVPIAYLTTSGGGSLTFDTNKGSITLPTDMLAGIPGAAGKAAQINIGQGDKTALPTEAQSAIGNRPLIQLSLTLDGVKTEWNNPNTPVSISIPYQPTPEELANPDSIVIWYIDGSGKLICISNGHYDAATGTVTFETTHFSLYAVGYHPVSFSDVAEGAWYYDAVSFVAARGITTGTGNGNFSPDKKLTRGEFIVMLMRAYGIIEDKNPTDNFTDAGNTYYTGYLAAAKRLGISNGVGNNLFAPEKQITRQEMFTLLYNALKSIGSLPKGTSSKALSDFSDSADITDWAKDAMMLLVESGTVTGSGEKLSPSDTTTRAEMAQVLHNLLGK